MDIKVSHYAKGRVRLKVRVLKGCFAMRDAIVESFEKLGMRADFRPYTGSIILFYSHEFNIEQIKDFLSKILDSKNFVKDSNTSRLLSDNFSLLVGIGYSVYVFIKKVFFKAVISEGLLSATSVVVLIVGKPIFENAYDDIKNKKLSLKVFLAGSSILAIAIGEALTALEIVLVTRLAHYFEEYITTKSQKKIKSLLSQGIKRAYIEEDGVEVEVSPQEIKKGDIVICRTGEKIAVDGVIIKGEAEINEAVLTGRSAPQVRRQNDKVFAGSLVEQGLIWIKAEKVSCDTYLARIFESVKKVLNEPCSLEQRSEKFARKLFGFGLFAVLGVFLVTGSYFQAFSVLLILACPCTTVLSASSAISAALVSSARRGVLIKGGEYLEGIRKVRCFCFDKTGTLTLEEVDVVKVIPISPFKKEASVLYWAAAAESHNQHPVAKAIVSKANELGLKWPLHEVCDFFPGKGVRSIVNGEEILVGNRKLMIEQGVELIKTASIFSENGYSEVYLAKNKQLCGHIILEHKVRPGVGETLAWLRQDGVEKICLITGDDESALMPFLHKFYFDEYRASLLPDEKAEFIEKLSKKIKPLAMVGDGVNDIHALAKADIGIAMGKEGAEVAVEVADIVLANSEIEEIAVLRRLSYKVATVIKQNQWLALSTNLGGVLLGFLGKLSPVIAGAFHLTHTAGIVLNSSRLLIFEEEKKDGK